MKIPFISRERPERNLIQLPGRTSEDAESFPVPITRSAQTLETYWRHYRENPIIRAAVVESVHALIGIPLVAEEYNEDARAWTPLPATDRLQRLLRYPSQSIPAAVFWGRQYTDFAVTGNMYLYKRRTGIDRVPAEFWRLHPNHTRPVPGATREVDGFDYNPKKVIGAANYQELAGRDEQTTRYDLRDVIHVAGDPDPLSPLLGLSPIAAALSHVDLYNAIVEFTTSVIERGAVPDYAFISKQRLSDQEARRIERRWLRRRSGPRNAGGLIAIDGTEGTLERMGLALGAREMGLTDLVKQVEAEILMAMDVPAIIVGATVGLENATYSNYMQAKLGFHEEHTEPNLWRFCSALEFGLTNEFPEHDGRLIRIRPDLSRVMALLDWEDKRRRLAIAEWREGLKTQDEARASVDLPPLPGGDFYTLPLNVTRITPGAPSSDRATLTGNESIALRRALRTGDDNLAVTTLAKFAQRLGADDEMALNIARAAFAERYTGPPNEGSRTTARRLAQFVYNAFSEKGE